MKPLFYIHHKLSLTGISQESIFGVVRLAWKPEYAILPRQCKNLANLYLGLIAFQYQILGRDDLADELFNVGEATKNPAAFKKLQERPNFTLLWTIRNASIGDLFGSEIISRMVESGIPLDTFYQGYFRYIENFDMLIRYYRYPLEVKRVIAITERARFLGISISPRCVIDTILLGDPKAKIADSARNRQEDDAERLEMIKKVWSVPALPRDEESAGKRVFLLLLEGTSTAEISLWLESLEYEDPEFEKSALRRVAFRILENALTQLNESIMQSLTVSGTKFIRKKIEQLMDYFEKFYE